MAKKMLIDATHAEETRVVVVDGNKVEEFDFESNSKRQLAGNIYLAKVTRVEPSLQAAFVDYGGNRHGFLAFSEIHPDYYQIPVADRQALMDEEEAAAQREAEEEDNPKPKSRRSRSRRSKSKAEKTTTTDAVVSTEPSQITGMETIDLDDDSDGDNDSLAVADAQPVEQVVADDTAQDTAADTEVSADAPTEEAAEPSAEAETSDAAGAADETEASDDDASADDSASDEAESDEDEEDEPKVKVADDDSIESVADDDTQEEIRPPRKARARRYKIQEVVKVRQIMLVQVVKEERGNKGAALTTYLSLAGRYCVLMPNTARGGGISRKITNAADRSKLKEIATSIDVPKGAGLIIRTAGAKRTKTEIKRDYEYLQRLWEQIRELTLQSIAPAKIYEEGDLIKRSIRDLYNRDIDEVFVEGERGYRTAKDFMKMIMPSHAKNVKHYSDSLPLFARYQVESYLGGMFNPTVQLKSGGYIVIGVTEALVAIDVNSGRATKEGSIEETALKTNLEAAEEVARQLRLRDLAGLIVIDFIDMDERKNNTAVEKRLKDKLKTDRARIQVGRISGFGLLEMSRQRLRPGMIEATTQPCPSCHGTGLIRSDDNMALQVLRQIEEEGTRNRSREVLVKAPVAIANFIMNQKREHIIQIEARYGLSVRIEGDPHLVSPDFTMEKFKTATRVVPEPTAPVVSASMALMEDIDAEEEEAEELNSEVENEAETEEKPKRRRRRRRKKKTNQTEGEDGQSDNNESTDTADNGSDESKDNAADEAKTDASEDAPAAEETTPDAEAEEKPKRRRRTRKKPEPKTEEAADGEVKEADAPADEAPKEEAATEEAPAEKPKRRRSPRKKKVEEPVAVEAAAVEPATEEETAAPTPVDEKLAEAPAEPDPAVPEVKDTSSATPEALEEAVVEPTPVPEAVEVAETVAEPAELVTAEAEAPAPEPAPAEPVAEEKPKPKRKGWWSIGR
ncbi:MAG: ribonuclease E/G [Thalassococcus sp.]|uniref:Rne/Rng family ribonuclease n=1 Tax=Thalassococcus sp. TaxID=1928858 RepID=UPI001B1E3DE5|nr:ribonuclease E/G [Thalassococcus sp.]MBO6866942.1 ribonuclease E/G [Thalassococcus sp.]